MQKQFPSTLIWILSGFLAFGSVLSAEESPEIKLQKTLEAVIDVLYQPGNVSVEEKRNQLFEVLERSFSFEVLVRRTLGRNWDKLNAEQQKKIVSLATDLMIHSYTKEFNKGIRPTVSIGKPVEIAPNKIEIMSVMALPDNKINLSFRLARLESGWQVYDLLAEGVSIVANYRKQFDAHFLKKNANELIDQLETKLEGL
jgi:phospholipid transport system substrate-binding protein